MKYIKKAVAFSILGVFVFTLGVSVILKKFPTRNAQEEKEKIPNNSHSYTNISADELNKYLESERDIFLVDVHTPEQNHIGMTDAFIPFDELSINKSKFPKDKNAEIVIYCRSGGMSKTASQELIDMGYTNVKNLSGGINAWKASGYSP